VQAYPQNKGNLCRTPSFHLTIRPSFPLPFSTTANPHSNHHNNNQHLFYPQWQPRRPELPQSNPTTRNSTRCRFFLSHPKLSDADLRDLDYDAYHPKYTIEKTCLDIHKVSCCFWVTCCCAGCPGSCAGSYGMEHVVGCCEWDFAVFGYAAIGLFGGCLILLSMLFSVDSFQILLVHFPPAFEISTAYCRISNAKLKCHK